MASSHPPPSGCSSQRQTPNPSLDSLLSPSSSRPAVLPASFTAEFKNHILSPAFSLPPLRRSVCTHDPGGHSSTHTQVTACSSLRAKVFHGSCHDGFVASSAAGAPSPEALLGGTVPGLGRTGKQGGSVFVECLTDMSPKSQNTSRQKRSLSPLAEKEAEAQRSKVTGHPDDNNGDRI